MANKRLRAALAAGVLAVLTGGAGPAAAGEVEWKILIDQANLHLQRGSVRQGEMVAREAVAEAERSFGPKHRAVDQSLATLGLVLRLAQRHPEA